MKIPLVHWRGGFKPIHREQLESMNLIETESNDDEVTEYFVSPDLKFGEIIQDLSQYHDIMITANYIAFDTYGYRFRTR